MSSKRYSVVFGGWRPRMSIGGKTLIAFLLIISVLAGSFYYFTTVTFTSQVEREAVLELDNKLRGAVRLYQSRMEQMKVGMLQAASEEAVQRAFAARDGAYIERLLKGYAPSRPYVDLWAAVDASGRVIAAPDGRAGQPFDVNGMVGSVLASGEPLVSTEAAPRDAVLLVNSGLSIMAGSPALVQFAVVPVISGGSAAGALVTGILLEKYEWFPLVVSESYGVPAVIAMAAPEGFAVVSASFARGGVLGSAAALPEVVGNSLRSNKRFSGREDLGGEDVFVAAEPVRDSSGRVVAGIAVGTMASDAVRHMAVVKRSMLVVTALGVLFSLLLAVVIYRDTSRPIGAITAAMDEIAEGNLNVRVDIQTGDDFERIGGGLNHMVESVQIRQARLDRFNELSHILIEAKDPEGLLHKSLGRLVELTSSSVGAVYLIDTGTGLLRPSAVYGAQERGLKSLKMGEGFAGRCALERKTITLEGLEDDYLSMETGFVEALPRSLAWFPMACKERLLGVFVIGSLKNYSEDDVGHMEHLVSQLSIALDNAIVHREVEKLSITDPLTGLYNRRYFMERLDTELKGASRYGYSLTLMMVDLDHFKSVNDTLGHQQGDALLSELGLLLRDRTRSSDLWGRYGGEEFIGYAAHTGREGASAMAEKIRKAVEEFRFTGMEGKRVTASIGAAVYPVETDGGLDADGLIRMADSNLYRAKRNGRNMVVL